MDNKVRNLQLLELDILKEIVAICDDNNLKYYIIGGTFLGAVRHKGFIPWDDDIDIAMPRNSYEKFLSIASNKLPKHMKIETFITNLRYPHCFMKVQNTNTKIIEYTDETHVCVDVFPIDGTPNSKYSRKWHCFRIALKKKLLYSVLLSPFYTHGKHSLKLKIISKIIKILPIDHYRQANKAMPKIDKLLKRHKVDNSNYIGTILGAYGSREIVPKAYFGDGAFYEFEGIKLRGPSMHNEYLAHIYGDYMKIPPIESQRTHYILE